MNSLSRLLRFLLLAASCTFAAFGLSADVDASSGSATARSDGFTFKAKFGSSEKNSTTSLVNYVSLTTTAPGARAYAEVNVAVSIYSKGALVTQKKTRQSFGAGTAAATKSIDVYAPSASRRASVRRGHNEIRVEINYVYTSALLNTTFDSETITLVVP